MTLSLVAHNFGIWAQLKNLYVVLPSHFAHVFAMPRKDSPEMIAFKQDVDHRGQTCIFAIPSLMSPPANSEGCQNCYFGERHYDLFATLETQTQTWA